MPFFAKFGGGNSNKFGFTRGASAPLTAPTSLSATAVNTSVSISFTAPTQNGGLPITNYEYSFNNSVWTALSPTDATSPVTVPGLTQNTGYTVYLRAVNAIGSGPASSGVSFTTEGIPTSAPSGLSAIQTDTSVAISFTAAASSTSLTNYEYSFNNSTWTALSPTDAVSPVTISGLSQNTAYTVYLRGVNSYGSGPASTGVSFTTYGPPTGSATISSVGVTATTATVNFSVAAGGGAITGYDLYVANYTNSWNNTTASPISVTGLTQNSYYVFYVRAKNAYGVGPQSAGYGVTTSLGPLPVNFYVLAGGGGGGGGYANGTTGTYWSGGGGGAGGLRTSVTQNGGGAGLDSAISFSSGASTTVTVGGGGAGGVVAGAGGGGGSSTFSSITATGGGAGNASTGGNAGSYGYAGRGPSNGVGGSGGGVGSASTVLIGTRYWGSSYYPGSGLANSITGASIARGGGGGNGGVYNVNGGENGIPGPSTDGSGSGGTNRANGNPGAGNYGGGGGGGSFYDYAGYTGGAGGSGIVIISYPTTYSTLTSITGLTYSYSVVGSNRVYQFTGGSGTIVFPTF